MRILLWLTVLIAISAASNGTYAQSCGSVATCRAVVDSIDTLRGGNYSGSDYAFISVTCYHAATTQTPCTGGGDFDRLPKGTGNCPFTHTGDNGATVIQDVSPYNDCFYRKNFGLNGVVDARQCGVVGDGKPESLVAPLHPDDGALLQNCLDIASGVGVPVVNTGGGVILDNSTRVVVPSNVGLSCGGGINAGGNHNDFRIFNGTVLNLAGAIILNPQLNDFGTAPLINMSAMELSDGSLLEDCLLEASDNNGAFKYSPSVWYPGCTDDGGCPDDTPTPQPAHVRSAIEERDSFVHTPHYICFQGYEPGHPAGCEIAISVGHLTGFENNDLSLPQYSGGSGATIRNVKVLGFGTCLLGTAPGLLADSFSGDCDSVVQQVDNDSPSISHISAGPVLTGGDLVLMALNATPSANFMDDGSGHYQVVAQTDTNTDDDMDFRVRPGDIVWARPDTGAESANGRWTIDCTTAEDGNCTTETGAADESTPGCPSGATCQIFTLANSVDSINTGTTGVQLANATLLASGYSPLAVTNLSFTSGPGAVNKASFIAVGQTVTDSAHCIVTSPVPTTVTAVWPALGIVYLSQTPTCAAVANDTITFADHAYSGSPSCGGGSNGAPKGCIVVDASFRFGDAFYFENSGGFRAYDCNTFEHEVSFHVYRGARGEFLSCATGNNVGLPDRNLGALTSTSGDVALNGNIISLLIDGWHHHDANNGSTLDGCDVRFTNGVLGQHRTAAIVVQSNCQEADKFTADGEGVDNDPQGIAVEVDAGNVLIASNGTGTGSTIFKASKGTFVDPQDGNPYSYKANLNLSNNDYSTASLYSDVPASSATTVGCGNTFSAPTPYLCAPSSFTQLPGGRLTLTQSQPVMQSDVTGSSVYYVPYNSQQVPIYNTSAGVFGLSDISPSGLLLNLDSTNHVPNMLYDVFAELDAGSPELCSGPNWANSGAGSSARASDVTQVNGVWANKTAISCHFNHNMVSGLHSCAPQECTYLGTFLTTSVGGQVAQQFGPVSGSGGGGPCLCLYNGYNRVTLTSRSLDTGSAYTFAGGSTSFSWEYMNNNSKNSIRVVDGLGQMQISSQLTDVMFSTASTKTAAIGVDLNPPAVSVPAPTPIVQTKSAASASYGHTLTNPPILGLWSAQAVDGALGTGGTANFGGNGLQQLSVQVSD